MSDERIKKIASEPAARPNAPSIMSAPRDKKKTNKTLILLGALIVSLVINLVLVISSLSKNERLTQLESEVTDYKADILELTTKLNSLESF